MQESLEIKLRKENKIHERRRRRLPREKYINRITRTVKEAEMPTSVIIKE